jgi:hypothetical protein
MSDKIPFAIFRCAKLKQGRAKGSFATSWRHLEKHKESAEISHPELSQYNLYKVHPKVAENGIKKVLSDIIKHHNDASTKKLRCDAALGVEMLFSYSPCVPFSLPFIEQYEKAMLDFIKSNYPDFKMMCIARHCDESSIHWHIVGVCLDEQKKICTKKVLGGPAEMRQAQSDFAAKVAHLGLKRGIPKKLNKNRRHTTKTEWQRRKEIERQAQKVLDEIGL